MKKAVTGLITALLIIVLLMPVAVFAEPNTGHIYNIDFEKIEDEIAVRNPLVIITNKNLDSSISAGAGLLSELKTAKASLEGERDGLIAKLGGIPADINNPSIDLTGLTSEQADEELIRYMNKIRLNYTLFRLADIDARIAGMADMNEANLRLQKETVLRQQSYITENLVIAMHESLLNQKEINNQLNMLKKQLAVKQLQEKLGLITAVDHKAFELEIKNTENMKAALDCSIKAIQGEINQMFGQEYDILLEIGELPAIDVESIKTRDTGHDFEVALATNYSLRQKSIGTTEYESEEDKLRADFYALSNEVDLKTEALELEKLKTSNEEIVLSHMALRYKLGLVSKLQYESAVLKYESQGKKLKEVEYDLFKTYCKYQWMKRGLSF